MSAPNTSALPRVERRRRDMRDRLYEAAIQLFQSQGYNQTTMDEIAELADTARGTVFNHYRTKSDFIKEWASRRRGSATQAMMAIPAEPGMTIAERVRAYFRVMGRLNAESYELTLAMGTGWVSSGGPIDDQPWLADELMELFRELHAEDAFRPEVDLSDLAHLLRDAYLGLMFRWLRNKDEHFDFPQALDRVIDLILLGALPAAPKDESAPAR
ncbi:TetR/AcrR family transcriptional regulator [Paenarthrobacter histidinolovorans]|uniref:AcrR family transcriptional regulator n=1 Tax=Paenarthrobacter histidinolovorans TaxID=43664 RepID=A0ABW8N297_9MICC|nr:TetR/AcrR family transcriptional regulator [Paenarthrobacter histidinolovorans]